MAKDNLLNWAWGDEGHKVICEIAFRLVQPNTRAEIQRLIKTDTPFCASAIPWQGAAKTALGGVWLT